jgi:hypothetical protein
MYSKTCCNGAFCVLKEAALILAADANRRLELDERIDHWKNVCQYQNDYIKRLEQRCYAYYDMIHLYNGGVINKLWIPPRRKAAMRTYRLRQQRKLEERRVQREKEKTLKKLRIAEEMDGDPRYEYKPIRSKYSTKEIII